MSDELLIVKIRNDHYPSGYVGTGRCTTIMDDRMAVDEKMNRLVAAQECDATEDDKNFLSWYQNNIATETQNSLNGFSASVAGK